MTNINQNSNYSPFLGILEGKRKARIEEEKRKTIQLEADTVAAKLKLEADLAAKGFTPAEVKQAQAETAIKAAQVESGNKLYYILAFVVLVVIVGVVLIRKSARK